MPESLFKGVIIHALFVSTLKYLFFSIPVFVNYRLVKFVRKCGVGFYDKTINIQQKHIRTTHDSTYLDTLYILPPFFV